MLNTELLLCRSSSAVHLSSNPASFVGSRLCTGQQPETAAVGILAGLTCARGPTDTLGFGSTCDAHDPGQEGLSPAGPGAVPASPAVGASAAGSVFGDCASITNCAGDCASWGRPIHRYENDNLYLVRVCSVMMTVSERAIHTETHCQPILVLHWRPLATPM